MAYSEAIVEEGYPVWDNFVPGFDRFRRDYINFLFHDFVKLGGACTDFACFIHLLNWENGGEKYHELCRECIWVLEQMRITRDCFEDPVVCIRKVWDIICNSELQGTRLLTAFQMLQWLMMQCEPTKSCLVSERVFLDTFVGGPAGERFLKLAKDEPSPTFRPGFVVIEECFERIHPKARVYKKITNNCFMRNEPLMLLLREIMSFNCSIFPVSFLELHNTTEKYEWEEDMTIDEIIFHKSFHLGMEDIVVMRRLHAYLLGKGRAFRHNASRLCLYAFLQDFAPRQFWERVEDSFVCASMLECMLQYVRDFLEGRARWRMIYNIKDTRTK